MKTTIIQRALQLEDLTPIARRIVIEVRVSAAIVAVVAIALHFWR